MTLQKPKQNFKEGMGNRWRTKKRSFEYMVIGRSSITFKRTVSVEGWKQH